MRQFFSTLRRRWKFGFVVFLLGSIATVLVVVSMTPLYGSVAKVVVSTTPDSAAEAASAEVVSQRVATYADLATDQSVLNAVAERLGGDFPVEDLDRDVSTSVVDGTQTIRVEARARTPELAQRIAAAEAAEIVGLVSDVETPGGSDADPAFVAKVAGDSSISSTPVAPDLPRYIGAGMLLSLLIAGLGIALRDALDRTIKSRHDIERISSVPVLATLPFTPTVRKEPLSTVTGGPLAEAFRVLRTNLQFASLDTDRDAFLVSSALPDEGKTIVASNLAISMAQSGRSVLLIDADLRNPNIARTLGLENSVGVLSVLVGRVPFTDALQTHRSGVRVLGTGPTPPNPAEVLESQAMRDLISQARREFDVVIVDAPPMLPVADASILLRELDGVLLLARHGTTTREQLRLALARIETVGTRLFGVVLNRTPKRATTSDGYGYGYGHGYGYGYPNSRQPRAAVPPPPPPAEPIGRRVRRSRRD